MTIATWRGSCARASSISWASSVRLAGRWSSVERARSTEVIRPRGSPVPCACPRGRPRPSSGRSPSGAAPARAAPSSTPMSPSRSALLISSATSRRWLRISTRASSMRLWTSLTRSLRRSSVSVGMLRRTTVPSTLGVRPTSLLRIAFSIAPERAAVPRLDDDRVCLGHADAGQLVERRLKCRSTRPGCVRPARWLRGRCEWRPDRARAPRSRGPSARLHRA